MTNYYYRLLRHFVRIFITILKICIFKKGEKKMHILKKLKLQVPVISNKNFKEP